MDGGVEGGENNWKSFGISLLVGAILYGIILIVLYLIQSKQLGFQWQALAVVSYGALIYFLGMGGMLNLTQAITTRTIQRTE